MIITALIIFTPFTYGTTPGHEVLVEEPVVKQKAKDAFTLSARDFLNTQEEETVKIWVYFTDKGVFNKDQFAAKRAEIVGHTQAD